MRRPVLTLLFLCSLTFFLGLGRQAITDSDEGFYAEAAREMVEGGDWITPHFNYEERWQKPVLYYWITAAAYVLTGPTEQAARWWSALSGLGLVLLTWAAARRPTPGPAGPGRHVTEEAAWLAGAIVATCFGCFAMARLALPDLPLAFLVTLAIWSALEDRWRLAGAAAGLGFAMKGPLAIALPAMVLVPIWWRERRLQALPWREVALAAVIFAVVGLPWYGAMTLQHGVAYLNSFFVGDNLERFATDRFNEPRPLWFYVPIVIGGMLPWSMYLAVLPWRSIRDLLRRTRQVSADEWRLLVWAFVPLLFFTLSIGKQPRYILPVLPPLGILLARSLTKRIAAADRPARRELAIATGATAALYAAFAVLLLRAQPLFITTAPVLTLTGAAAIAGGALALGSLAATRRWRALPVTTTACAAVLLLSIQFGALAGRRPEAVEQMAALLRQYRQGDQPVGLYRVFVRNLAFYSRSAQIDLFGESQALDFLKSPDRVLLVVRDVDLPRLEAMSGVITQRLGEVQYLNTNNIRVRTVLSPAPSQNLERVLLVANRAAGP
ncbi:MAG: glycosyltransferase family 39 protein [Acidobacteria bacterium]|nr:glycosyltransferase family 39 protein [Acidobacteriota bacterium]